MMKRILAGCFLLSLPGMANAEPLKLPPASINDVLTARQIINPEISNEGADTKIEYKGVPRGGYIVSNTTSKDDWHLSMGPVDTPKMTIRSKKIVNNGVLIFSCERYTGKAEIALIIDGIDHKVNDKVPLYLSIGSQSHVLETVVNSIAPDGKNSILHASGDAVIDILSAIGDVSSNNMFSSAESFRFDDMNGHVMNVPYPYGDMLKRQSDICSGWYNEYNKKLSMEKIGQEIVKNNGKDTTINDISGTLNRH